MGLFHGKANPMNYTIGQVAKINHLSISQLRYYDTEENSIKIQQKIARLEREIKKW
jgi:hypothetical protein